MGQKKCSISSNLEQKAHKVIKFGTGSHQCYLQNINLIGAELFCMASWHVNARNYGTVDHIMRQF